MGRITIEEYEKLHCTNLTQENYNGQLKLLMDLLGSEDEYEYEERPVSFSNRKAPAKKSIKGAKRGQYNKPSKKQKDRLLHMYYIEGRTIVDSATICGLKRTTAAGYISKWRNKTLPDSIKNMKAVSSLEKSHQVKVNSLLPEIASMSITLK